MWSGSKNMGWIKTHRSGPTGIGKTLEDLLGIPENNLSEPDFGLYELKAARLNSNAMLTAFSLAPEYLIGKDIDDDANRYLLNKYGYMRNGERVLRNSLKVNEFTHIPSGHKLKLTLFDDALYFESEFEIENIGYHIDTLL